MKSPIIAALDVPSGKQAVALVDAIAPYVGAVKIGKQLFVSEGPGIVRQMRERGVDVFLDLKFHDIPNTVAKATEAATRLDVQMLTIHCSGGPSMMEAAERAARETAATLGRPAPLILGVTILTSLTNNELDAIGMQPNVAYQVERLASLAVQSGLRGLVCSPLEIVRLKQFLPQETQLVTPGIRAQKSSEDDQQRTLNAHEAITAGASWLVIGRPIYAADNPAQAAKDILDSLSDPPV